jgi:WD40 repeat protein
VRHPGAVYSAAFSPDGRHIVTGSEDRTARIWSLPRGRLEHELFGHTSNVYDVAFSSDGRLVITAGDTTTRVWRTATGSPLAVLHMHADGVNAVAVARDGLLATGSDDRTAHLYRCTTCGSAGALLALASKLVTRDLTRAERARFTEDGG